jgi:hypothetical protein
MTANGELCACRLSDDGSSSSFSERRFKVRWIQMTTNREKQTQDPERKEKSKRENLLTQTQEKKERKSRG